MTPDEQTPPGNAGGEQAPGADAGREPTPEELQAALEAELKRVQVDEILLQTIVSLVNLGGRRTGLAPGAEDERDPEQVRVAVEALRALLPVVEPRHGDKLGPIRDALSQLQMAYAQMVKEGGAEPTAPEAAGEGAEKAAGEGEPGAADPASAEKPPPGRGPAQSSGRLWVPGRDN